MNFNNSEPKFTKAEMDEFKAWAEKVDAVNNPPHYTQGRWEAIDVIEDVIEHASSAQAAFLQGQVLKYMLRLWHKDNAKEDAEKAQWYLNRLINSLDLDSRW